MSEKGYINLGVVINAIHESRKTHDLTEEKIAEKVAEELHIPVYRVKELLPLV